MPDLTILITVLEEARALLMRPDNDFAWSSWEDRDDALAEVDALIARLRAGELPEARSLSVLFAPTGPLQEVSISSGWGDTFLLLARRFDDAIQ